MGFWGGGGFSSCSYVCYGDINYAPKGRIDENRGKKEKKEKIKNYKKNGPDDYYYYL